MKEAPVTGLLTPLFYAKLIGMQTVQLEEAQAHLVELVEGVAGGQEVVIAKGDSVLAKLVPADTPHPTPHFGSARRKISFEQDWDGPIPGLEEYQ